ncbi:MAG: hypothetical protein ABI690_14270 [Chloroflexota bacterium]
MPCFLPRSREFLALQGSANPVSATITQTTPNSYSVMFLSANLIISYQ